MSQVIKIKRGGISGLSGASTTQGELIIATGSIGSIDGPLLLAHGDSLGLVAGRVYAGSSVPTISDSELDGILFYDTVNKKFVRLESGGNVDLDIEATSFSGDTDGVSEGSTNLYYTDARVKTKLNSEGVVSGSKTNVLTFLNVEDGADVTDTVNVTAAGALMDSEVTNLAQVKAFDSSDYATAAQGTLADSAQQPPSEGAFVDGDKTKLDGIESGADVTDTANVTAAGALMDSEVTNLDQVKSFDSSDYATAAQGTLADSAQQPPSEGAFVDGDKTKLDGIESGADVTDTANVTAAGALMDSEVTNLADVKAFDPTDYATAAQGTTADNALPKAGGQMTGNITFSGTQTVDGRDLSADGTKLDGIEAGADVTDTANVTAAGALMDSELTSITDVKALNQSVVSGASPNFSTANMTDASNKRFMTDAQETKLDSVESGADVTDTANVTAAGALMDSELTNLAAVKAINQGLTTTSNVTFASGTFDSLTVEGNLSVEGTLTTVNSSEVNIGDRIIVLNTANGAGDAGIQVHDIDAPASTGSLLYESEGNYWKAGVKDSEKRVVTFNADNPTNDSFIHLNGSDEIVAVASGSNVGAFLQKSAGGFTVSNVVDGGTY